MYYVYEHLIDDLQTFMYLYVKVHVSNYSLNLSKQVSSDACLQSVVQLIFKTKCVKRPTC